MSRYITEKDIQSYMTQFNVNKEIAIKEIEEILKDYCNEQKKQMQEVYQDIIKSSY